MASTETAWEPTTVRAVAGSALSWAWFDALFMGSFFPAAEIGASVAEMSSLAVYLASALVSLLPFLAPTPSRRLLEHAPSLAAIGVCGTLGTTLLATYSYLTHPLLLVAGGTLAGLFMGASQIAWGAIYCRDGERSATPVVAGSLALAVVLDVMLLLMAPLATAVLFAVFPAASMAVFATLPPERRAYDAPATKGIGPVRGPAAYIRTYFGVSVTLFFAIVLVMTGFGYVQHISSFSSATSALGSGGVFVQLVRGGVAVAQFVLVALLSWRVGAVYRAGLLVMIGGFMAMPLALTPEAFIVSAAVIVGGYTVFDLLKWCVFSQIAHTQSCDALKTIALLRLVSSVCYLAGTGLGMGLVGADYQPDAVLAGETNVVGYLVVIATVLLLSSQDIWGLFASHARTAAENDIRDNEDAASEASRFNRRLVASFEGLGLTEREQEIALLLVRGRTQPWIAEFLGISESTVGTHVRHIYQKAGVHTRQEFLDGLEL